MNSKETKRQLLKEMKAWNLYPENVKAEIFHTHPFFDPEDKAQVKYEMMRARETEGIPGYIMAQWELIISAITSRLISISAHSTF
ncbi:MAG: hypothetical protein JSV09_09840 [Thermoplasmata archaeon]|nr:MAG: hypothetical protein JSV09_09840 [Thermoplasmata archaeon]